MDTLASGLTGVNDNDMLASIGLGCQTMQSVFNSQDSYRPWFGQFAVPYDANQSRFEFNPHHHESHVPGRHLWGLLEARSIGVSVSDTSIVRHRADANRMESLIGAITRFWVPTRTRNLAAMRVVQSDIELVEWDGPFVSGVARAIGPLAKYWHTSRSRGQESLAAWDLLQVLVARAREAFLASGVGLDHGTHSHSISCTLSGLAQYADLASTYALTLGGHSGWGELFRGGLEDVRVFDRALTATEVGALR